jgi:hypothetical protein
MSKKHNIKTVESQIGYRAETPNSGQTDKSRTNQQTIALGQTAIISTEMDKTKEKKIYENIYLDKSDISVNKQIDR